MYVYITTYITNKVKGGEGIEGKKEGEHREGRRRRYRKEEENEKKKEKEEKG